MTKDSLGDRMKAYERRETDHRFMNFAPVIARMDGRGFSRWTKGLARPYDEQLSQVMVEVTRHLVEETGARIGYTQSDEITLVLLVEDIKQMMMFDGKAQKLCSVLASMTTAKFITECLSRPGTDICERAMQGPHFDARVFQVPNRTEAANAVLWREKDACKNAVSMAARAFHPHAALQGRSSSEMQEMIFASGQNFNDYPASFKRGTFLQARTRETRLPDDVLRHLPEGADTTVLRRSIEALDMPIFSKVVNREEVIFDGAEPSIETEEG
jgi:tRNA(His) 5'-end guanylyltransferase